MEEYESCVFCLEPLGIDFGSDSDEDDQVTGTGKAASVPNRVLDDVELACGCHYHWECFFEAYKFYQCPSCEKEITSQHDPRKTTKILCTVRNEGGVQENFDILPALIEESYLETRPKTRIGYAFLQFCSEGDVDAVLTLVRDNEWEVEANDGEDDPAETKLDDVLRYQKKPALESGLHVAIQAGHEEVVWLLLALGSELPWSEFPLEVQQAIERMEIKETDRRSQPDIRGLKDSQERTAAALAREIGGIWTKWLNKGLLDC